MSPVTLRRASANSRANIATYSSCLSPASGATSRQIAALKVTGARPGAVTSLPSVTALGVST
jgi:hypothetical protein